MAAAVPIMAAVGLASTVVGSVVGAMGAEQTAQAQNQMYQYQARVANLNSTIAKQNAAYALYAGEVQTQQAGMQAKQQIGETRAIQGSSNLAVGSGTGASVVTSEQELAQQSESLVRADAAKRAYGYEVEATSATAQAQLDTMAGRNALVAGDIGATSSILGGASSVSSKWAQASQTGIFSQWGVPGGASGGGLLDDSGSWGSRPV